MPSCFICQFGYDQLYIKNPNSNMHYKGNLFEGVRVNITLWKGAWMLNSFS